MRKESIFDLYNEQHKDDKQAEPERLPDEVAPEPEPEKEVPAAPEPKQETKPEPPKDPKPENKEGGNSDGV